MTNYAYDGRGGLAGGMRFPVQQASQLYSSYLASVFRSGLYVYDPSYPLAQDIEWWGKLQRDPICASSVLARRHAVAGGEWSLEPASDAKEDVMASDILEQIVAEIPKFQEARFNLTDAVFRGSAYAVQAGDYALWSPVVGKNENARRLDQSKWWIPNGIKDIDRRRVILRKPDDDPNGRPVWHIARVWDDEGQRFWDYEPIPEGASYVVKWVYQDCEERLGYGQGLGEALYFPWSFKMAVLEQGLQGAMRWARGVTIWRQEQDRAASDDRDNDTIQTQAMTQMVKDLSDGVVAISKDDELSFENGPTAGSDVVDRLVKYADDCIRSVCMGSTMPTGGGTAQGSLARAEVESDQSDSYIQPDITSLEEALTESVVLTCWRLNRHKFRELGLQNARMPKFRLGMQRKADAEKAIQILDAAVRLGVPVSKETAYDMLGIERPGETDALVEPPQQPEPAPMQGGFGFSALQYSATYEGGKSFGQLSEDQRQALRSWWSGGKEGAPPVKIDEEKASKERRKELKDERKAERRAAYEQMREDGASVLGARGRAAWSTIKGKVRGEVLNAEADMLSAGVPGFAAKPVAILSGLIVAAPVSPSTITLTALGQGWVNAVPGFTALEGKLLPKAVAGTARLVARARGRKR